MEYTLIRSEDKKPENNMLVTQSNKLVEARYTLTLYEQRLVLMMIAMIEPDDEDFKGYVIRIADFSDLIGLKNKNIYSKIKGILRGLRKKELIIPLDNKDDFLITGWISSAKYLKSEGIVKLSFDANLKPFLLQLKQEFTKQRLGQIIKFKGVYTIRIYGLLKQYQKLGTRSFSVIEFREILGIDKKKYKAFRDLKLRTIIQAQKEFSQKDENGAYFSDINFTFEAIKTGRKVTALKFNIFSQNTSPASVPNIAPQKAQEQSEEVQDETISKLVQLGIAKTKADKYLLEYGKDYINEKIDLLIADMELGMVKSPAGYLTSAITQDWTSAKIALKNQEKEKKEKEKQARLKTLAKELREEQEKILSDEFTEKARAEFLSSLSEEEKESLLDEIKGKYTFMAHQIKDLNHTMAKAYLVEKIPNYKERKQNYINKNLKI